MLFGNGGIIGSLCFAVVASSNRLSSFADKLISDADALQQQCLGGVTSIEGRDDACKILIASQENWDPRCGELLEGVLSDSTCPLVYTCSNLPSGPIDGKCLTSWCENKKNDLGQTETVCEEAPLEEAGLREVCGNDIPRQVVFAFNNIWDFFIGLVVFMFTMLRNIFKVYSANADTALDRIKYNVAGIGQVISALFHFCVVFAVLSQSLYLLVSYGSTCRFILLCSMGQFGPLLFSTIQGCTNFVMVLLAFDTTRERRVSSETKSDKFFSKQNFTYFKDVSPLLLLAVPFLWTFISVIVSTFFAILLWLTTFWGVLAYPHVFLGKAIPLLLITGCIGGCGVFGVQAFQKAKATQEAAQEKFAEFQDEMTKAEELADAVGLAGVTPGFLKPQRKSNKSNVRESIASIAQEGKEAIKKIDTADHNNIILAFGGVGFFIYALALVSSVNTMIFLLYVHGDYVRVHSAMWGDFSMRPNLPSLNFDFAVYGLILRFAIYDISSAELYSAAISGHLVLQAIIFVFDFLSNNEKKIRLALYHKRKFRTPEEVTATSRVKWFMPKIPNCCLNPDSKFWKKLEVIPLDERVRQKEEESNRVPVQVGKQRITSTE